LLEAGTIVICDRYAFSGIAFSAGKGLPYDWCRSPDVGLPAPDLTLFFDVSPEVARVRGGYGDERYENEELQRRVREVFERIAKEMQEIEQYIRGASRWARVNTDQGLHEVEESVRAVITPLLRGQFEPLQRLWTE
jgi:dTMP kinase